LLYGEDGLPKLIQVKVTRQGRYKVASAKTLEKGMYTTLGSARKTVDFKNRFPKTTALSLDFYLLSKPIQELLTCNDPDVDSDESYLKKAKELARELTTLARRIEALA
jgi:hypothetical protein